MKKRLKAYILTSLTVVAVLVCIFSFSKQGFSQVGSDTKEVIGYGWSENIGWISFSSKNCDTNGNGTFEGPAESAPSGCPTSGVARPYRVTYSLTTNNLSGYAWSEHIGWISFNETGCPRGDCQPRLEEVEGTKKMKGWVKALSADGNGWDGWISLGTQTGESIVYGPTQSGNTLSGYPWGSDVVGWMHMDVNLDTGDGFFNCGSSAGATPLADAPTTNLCTGGAVASPDPVTTTPTQYTWTCTLGLDSGSCSAPRGALPINGVCSGVQNQCISGTPNPNSPPDGPEPSRVNWSCMGANRGTSATNCTYICPNGGIPVGGVCPPTDICVPVITTTQNRSIVTTQSETCNITWTVRNDEDTIVGNATLCDPGTFTCRFDNGTPASGPYSQDMAIGTHSITCTNTVTGQESTYIPHPQCRLNLNYGEF